MANINLNTGTKYKMLTDIENEFLDEASGTQQTLEINEFENFNLHKSVLKAIKDMGFTNPSPIQKEAIPVVLAGKDLIGMAQTGTGKTAAFGLPAISQMASSKEKLQLLVVTPTRELANQVSEELYKIGKYVGLKTVAVYGGQSYGRQIDSIRRGAEAIVATPGRLIDLLEGGRIQEAFSPSIVVLDEADEMLDMGFLDDIKKICEYLPEERQTLLFSATMPPPIQKLSEQFLKDPVEIRVNRQDTTNRDIEQFYYVIDESERNDATIRLIDSLEPSRSIIFCRTKREVDRLAGLLAARGVLSQGLHGDMEQPMRERVIAGFRQGDFQILVATDVAARGIDIPGISHVFNYHLPFDTESYVHRIGRTGRAGKKGVAVTLVTPSEFSGLKRIKTKVGKLQNRLIPTHRELKETTEIKLLDCIRNQHVEQDAERFLTTLSEEMGLAQAANKLAALLLGREAVQGPDRIGIQGARLERLQGQLEPRQQQQKHGDRRGGGGGGRNHNSSRRAESFRKGDVKGGRGGFGFGGKNKSGSFDKPFNKEGKDRKPEGQHSEGGRFEGKKFEGGRFEGKRSEGNKFEGKRFEAGRFDGARSEGGRFEKKSSDKEKPKFFEGGFKGKKKDGKPGHGKGDFKKSSPKPQGKSGGFSKPKVKNH